MELTGIFMMKNVFIGVMLWIPLVVNAGDGLIALYPLVKTSYQGNEIVVSFLSTGGSAPAGLIYAISLPSLASTFIRAPASLGEGKIISVFFYERKSLDVRQNEKSMFVINERTVNDAVQHGHIYTISRFSLIPDTSGLLIKYYDSDNRDERFINCFEGVYVTDNKQSSCQYKSPQSVIKALGN